MASITINVEDVVIFEGVSKKNNKPYAFAKLDRRLANSKTFVDAAKEAGAKVNPGGNTDQGEGRFQVNA